jgi:UDP-N-acetylmuramoyl-L-alanyl-D-glutamate--2,6-diaminopimelate ligase
MTTDGLTAILVTPAGTIDIRSPLIGAFNIYNIMAASAAAFCLGVDPEAVSLGIANLKGIPGRLELVTNRHSLPIVVDYAHTPDALLKALEAVRPLVEGRLITVFGCGGDRDKGKRREMGRVAGEHSDLVFITSDNPRTEDPADIVAEIEEGVIDSGSKKLENFSGSGRFLSGKREGFGDRLSGSGYVVELERGSAIRTAVGIADKRDLVLIAGKGHEDYQIIGTQKRDFNDRKVAAEAASGVV